MQYDHHSYPGSRSSNRVVHRHRWRLIPAFDVVAPKTHTTNANTHTPVSRPLLCLFLPTFSAVNQAQRSSLKGTLHLVDLAGSERLSRSNATGDRLKETVAINKSLSSLTDVFVSISNKSSHVRVLRYRRCCSRSESNATRVGRFSTFCVFFNLSQNIYSVVLVPQSILA